MTTRLLDQSEQRDLEARLGFPILPMADSSHGNYVKCERRDDHKQRLAAELANLGIDGKPGQPRWP